MTDELSTTSGQKGYTAILATVFAALLVASIGQGFIAWRDLAVLSNTVEELRDTYITDAATLAAIAQQSHANTIHRTEHERQAEYWISRIQENERAIGQLQNQPSARADPFTGADGRALRDRIERLEQVRQ